MHNFITIARVQITCRLIGKDQFRIVYYSTCYGHALLLTSGKLLWKVISTMHDLHLFQDLFDAAFAFCSWHIGVDQWQFYIFKYS
ncbi:Uncharacterised protein [Mycobacterium tuberculosis]|nr:Uncharacterised protein [Mycobacterium tuberculosis]